MVAGRWGFLAVKHPRHIACCVAQYLGMIFIINKLAEGYDIFGDEILGEGMPFILGNFGGMGLLLKYSCYYKLIAFN